MASVRSDVDEIKRRANIVDVVSEYVNLRKTGINYTGLCPFHKEKTPSFSVNVDKQIFYCFGCGEGGDVFAFLMKVNNMTFPEALRLLAGKLGIVLSQDERGQGGREQKSLREDIYRINRLAADYFAKNIFSEAGKGARAYIEKRKISSEVIKTFHLGYALDGWRNLRGFFERGRISPKLLEKAGLLIPKGEGDFYDRFRGRLMFPIEGLNGNVIAFGGRSLGDEMPKYLNSPESPVYTKGKNLYGLGRAREAIRHADETIVVEGYFDFLQLWNAGIRNVVATLGTALTRDHLDLIRRYTRNIVVLFDPDEGGRSAVERSLRLFLSEGVHARVVILPEGYDPDSFVMTFGKQALDDRVSRSQSMVDYYIDHVLGKRGGLEENLSAARDAVGFIAHIEEAVQRNLFIKRVSERLGIDQEILKTEVRNAAPKAVKGARTDRAVRAGAGKIDAVELSFLHLLMDHPQWVPVVREERLQDYLLNDDAKSLLQTLLDDFEQQGRIDSTRVIHGLHDGAWKDNLLRLVMSGSPYDVQVAERVFADTVKKIKQRWFKERHNRLKKELAKAQEAEDEKRCKQILVEKERLMQEEKALSSHFGEKK